MAFDRVRIPPLSHEGDGLRVSGRSDVGRVRKENQDFLGFFQAGGRSLLVVADGMGGHSGGWEASRIAVARIGEIFGEHRGVPEQVLEEALVAAHHAVVEEARQRPALAGMGSTAVVGLLEGDRLWVAHVGDSRAYLLSEGVAERLTRDHTQVNRMVDAGLLTEEEAANHSMGHVLDRSLGSDMPPTVELSGPLRFDEGQRLVLCSDGLSNLVPDDEIAEIFLARDLDQAVQRGLGLALLRGGGDNTTIGALERGLPSVPGRSRARAVVTVVVAGLVGLLLGLALG